MHHVGPCEFHDVENAEGVAELSDEYGFSV